MDNMHMDFLSDTPWEALIYSVSKVRGSGSEETQVLQQGEV
jgi:hypothetical protein